MMPVLVDCLALCDVEDARRFYERRHASLGENFQNAVEAAWGRVAANPLLFPQYAGEFRKCRVRDFPFGVIYRCDGTTVQILAVMHLKRGPNWLKQRLESSAKVEDPSAD